MKVYNEEEDCCGCALCKETCPVKAITMEYSGEGFLYPVINNKICIKCGLCEKICIFSHPNINEMQQDFFVTCHSNDEVLKKSSSGGVFTAVADAILEQNGAVYGATFTNDFTVTHSRAISKEEYKPMHGSKYVQSEIQRCYVAIAQDLKKGTPVLFTGTPCQVAAISEWLNFKKINQEKFYTIDLICHGVSSLTIWRDLIKKIEMYFNDTIIEVNFRSKDWGWSKHVLKVITKEHGNISEECAKKFNFYNLYSSQLINRKSCYCCPYSTKNRVGDFTIGDFVGIEKVNWEFDAEKGVSVLITNTEKAKKILPKLKLELKQLEFKQCLQPGLEYSPAEPKARKILWQRYYTGGIELVLEKYGKLTFEKKVIYKIIVPICKKIGIYNFAAKIYLKK